MDRGARRGRGQMDAPVKPEHDGGRDSGARLRPASAAGRPWGRGTGASLRRWSQPPFPAGFGTMCTTR
jgi:hypothetical protein